MNRRAAAGVAVLTALAGCSVPDTPRARVQLPPPSGLPAPPGTQPSRAPERLAFSYAGSLIQGGLVIGIAPARTVRLTVDGAEVPIAPDGRFALGFDRDARSSVALVATRDDGRQLSDVLAIAPRHWDISRLATLPKYPVPAPEFARLRPAELAQIAAARAQSHASDGWREPFLWPATARISTLFGSQRIYRNGEAGAYHSGIDIAVPTGTPVRAPADGVVILAPDHPFTLEGNLLMVDHGMGLNSAFLHLSRIVVRPGEAVRRGEIIAYSGATGRATGPHLHWSLQWRGAKLDPLLAAGPMAGAR